MEPAIPSEDVYKWPEFIAFANRLGISLDNGCPALVISLRYQEPCIVSQEYRGKDRLQDSPLVNDCYNTRLVNRR